MIKEFQLTNRLRTEGTRNLLTAASANGVRRVLAEGLAYAYDPEGSGPADEDQPLWRDPPRQFAPALKALIELEQQTRKRVGWCYALDICTDPAPPLPRTAISCIRSKPDECR